MNRYRIFAVLLGALVLILVAALSLSASTAELYFSSDRSGAARVTNVQEGSEVWIVVVDPDENTDCDVRDKFWTDVKLMDPKTGAFIVWESYLDADGDANELSFDELDYVPYKGHWPGAAAGWLGGDYFEETSADTGVFVSKRAFRIGMRESFSASEPWKQTHVVDQVLDGQTDDFRWGHYLYADHDGDGFADNRGWFGAGGTGTDPKFNLQMMLESGGAPYSPASPSSGSLGFGEYLIGRFENMDTLIGMVQDPDDATDVAIAMMKIIDTEATLSWDREIYPDANEAATLTVVDPDENLDCSEVEYVPVFILVNPGSWNPVLTGTNGTTRQTPTNFCMLLRSGGIDPWKSGEPRETPIRWYNIYNSGLKATDYGTPPLVFNRQDRHLGAYYVAYPMKDDGNVTWFDTEDWHGRAQVSFYAQETAADSGVFQLNLNHILRDLGFKSLRVGDVLVAYYLDPNDSDDFKLATATIEERQHSVTTFVDEAGTDVSELRLGRDSIYVRVIDANANVDSCCPEQVLVHVCDPHGEDDSEWLTLDESGSNSSIFFTYPGTPLRPVWDALGVGFPGDAIGGYQLELGNWRIEAFNEDDLYARYNDVVYGEGRVTPGDSGPGPVGNPSPPHIDFARVANDLSFGRVSIADTQVFDGTAIQMAFLDRQGNRVSGYINSDCVFIEVIDPDQDEDQLRRERIDGFWDGGQNIPFGPKPRNEFGCNFIRAQVHPVNALLGDTNIFNDSPDPNPVVVPCDGEPKVYVLNPRSGRWAAVDLLESGTATGDFVSVLCIDLTDVHECVPTLDALPGDTIVAFYQDPSNHSDSAMISVKVGIGGGGSPSLLSTTTFVDADGQEVESYTVDDAVYVRVTDPSHAGAALLTNAVEIEGSTYDLTLWYDVQTFAAEGTFLTEALDLDLTAGTSITATYTDPTDPTDSSSDTASVLDGVLEIDRFVAWPNPFQTTVTFSYDGSGIATAFSIDVYDLAGHPVWSTEETNVSAMTWDGVRADGRPAANGPYIYVASATDGTLSFTGKGILFVNRRSGS